jgi:hypothetical protein
MRVGVGTRQHTLRMVDKDIIDQWRVDKESVWGRRKWMVINYLW